MQGREGSVHLSLSLSHKGLQRPYTSQATSLLASDANSAHSPRPAGPAAPPSARDHHHRGVPGTQFHARVERPRGAVLGTWRSCKSGSARPAPPRAGAPPGRGRGRKAGMLPWLPVSGDPRGSETGPGEASHAYTHPNRRKGREQACPPPASQPHCARAPSALCLSATGARAPHPVATPPLKQGSSPGGGLRGQTPGRAGYCRRNCAEAEGGGWPQGPAHSLTGAPHRAAGARDHTVNPKKEKQEQEKLPINLSSWSLLEGLGRKGVKWC